MSISDRKTEVHNANELVEPIDEIRYFFESVNELELGLYSSSNNLTTSIWLEKLPGLGGEGTKQDGYILTGLYLQSRNCHLKYHIQC